MSIHDLSLSHYTNASDIVPYDVTQDHSPVWGKPRGLWVSVDGPDDWASWCREEQFRNVDAQNRFRVELDTSANIVHLKDAAAIFQFSDKYGSGSAWSPTGTVYDIAWTEVASEYQGIVIAPYSWQARHDMRSFWYYGWDCASGCIWDASAIKSVTLMTGDVS